MDMARWRKEERDEERGGAQREFRGNLQWQEAIYVYIVVVVVARSIVVAIAGIAVAVGAGVGAAWTAPRALFKWWLGQGNDGV